MTTARAALQAVESPEHVAAASTLVAEYLAWVADIARSSYGLTFDVDDMLRSDLEDRSKFYPPSGRFYLVRHDNAYVGVGCLKALGADVCELQRMYVQPGVRGIGAGRLLLARLLDDARAIGYRSVRLESLRALAPAHRLYRSVGFHEVAAYSENSMQAYQPPETLAKYRDSAVFMEPAL